jgi:hypothetical protein
MPARRATVRDQQDIIRPQPAVMQLLVVTGLDGAGQLTRALQLRRAADEDNAEAPMALDALDQSGEWRAYWYRSLKPAA